MAASRESFFINSEGPDQKGLRAGLEWAFNVGEQQVLFAVPVRDNLDGDIKSLLGEAATRALKKNGEIKTGTVTLVLATEKNVPRTFNGSIVAFYPTQKLLDQLDGVQGVRKMLVLPWSLGEVSFWVDTWKAIDLASGKSPARSSGLSATVVNALKNLTNRVNLSTGLGHPNDHASAVELFEILVRGSEPFTPAAVRAWLVSEGNWKPQHADKVKEISERVLNGTRVKRNRLAGPQWCDDILDIWRSEAIEP